VSLRILHIVQLHIVHWNTELCSNVAEAVKSATGIAVLGVFFEVNKQSPSGAFVPQPPGTSLCETREQD